MLEILAPAGSMDALHAAVQNGANAVYLGCGTFNARQSAKNFTPESLVEAIKYCHIRGVQVHLTLNTLVTDREMNDVIKLIRHAATAGVDAFIVQDLGVIRLCRQIAPHIPVHGSTQLTVHSLADVQLCAAWGLTRVVLSRELNRDEIRYICANSPIEIEVFGHGALCMCYSGQCYLSAVIGSRSGNRGRCAQPCRLGYGYGRWENKHPLSLKDNCLVEYLHELEAMGVRSVKLEGRMKRAEYVAAVTGVYSQAAKTYQVTPQMREQLHTAFNRQGFTDGYYMDRTGNHMFGVREAGEEDAAWCRQMRQTYEGVEAPRVPIEMEAVVRNTGSTISVRDPEGRICTIQGPMPEMARMTELTDAALAERLSKTGGTPYYCTNIHARVEYGLTLSAAAINGMRREVLNRLTALRARTEPPILGRPEKLLTYKGERQAPGLTVQITAREQLTNRLLAMKPEVLYVPLHILAEDGELCRELCRRVKVCAVLPRIVHDGEGARIQQAMDKVRLLGVEEVLVGNLGHILMARESRLGIRGDFGLNIFNSGTMQTMRELELLSACLSFELNLAQIRDMSKAVKSEILAYGRMPLMVTENCLIRGRTGVCSCAHGGIKLTDRTGADFPVIKDGGSCRSVLLNGKKLYWLDRQKDLSRLGLWAVRLYFTTENPKEVDQILSFWNEPIPFDPGACTRGLYLRGVE